jgi:hypothetical protein
MCVAPSIVPSGRPRDMLTLGFNLLLPHPAITHTTTLGVAVGPWKLHYGEPPVNMQLLHSLVDTKMPR